MAEEQLMSNEMMKPLEACNSREEIEAWLDTPAEGTTTPRGYHSVHRAAALARMEAIARAESAPLRGALVTQEMVDAACGAHHDINRAAFLRHEDVTMGVLMKGVLEAALATAPEAATTDWPEGVLYTVREMRAWLTNKSATADIGELRAILHNLVSMAEEKGRYAALSAPEAGVGEAQS